MLTAGEIHQSDYEFGQTMAGEIESVFEELWQNRHGTPLPEEMKEDRRMLFVAIAKGVLRHLEANLPQSIHINTSQWGSNTYRHTHTTTVSSVDVSAGG